jgi:hypothetical protein
MRAFSACFDAMAAVDDDLARAIDGHGPAAPGGGIGGAGGGGSRRGHGVDGRVPTAAQLLERRAPHEPAHGAHGAQQSRLRAAALLAEAGKREAALGEWDALAHDSAADPLYRDLATLYWALHGLDEGPGAIDPATLDSRLAPLANGPWKASVAELRALVALRRGDAAAARGLLGPLIADPAAPPGMRERAQRLLTGIAG